MTAGGLSVKRGRERIGRGGATGTLTAEEIDIIGTHAAIGAKILGESSSAS